MMVSVSLPLFLALTVLASVGLGYVCCVISDSLAAPDRPFADDWWSEDDVTVTLSEIKRL